jgi:hypothetical protein
VDHGNGQKRVEAHRDTFPPDDQPAVFLLEPGKRPLGLEAWHLLFDWSITGFLRLPDPFRHLPSDATAPELLAEGFGIIPFIRCEDLEAFPRSARFARMDLDGIE